MDIDHSVKISKINRHSNKASLKIEQLDIFIISISAPLPQFKFNCLIPLFWFQKPMLNAKLLIPPMTTFSAK